MQMVIIDVPFGRNIQKIRKSRNMTQEDAVAELQLRGSHMSRCTLAHIERGRRNIKINDLVLMKMIYDVDFDAFFDYDTQESGKEK